MAAIVSPALGLDLPAAGTNPRLFWTQGHRQCGQPTICIPEPYLCQGRGLLRLRRGSCRTDRLSTVYEEERTNMSPCDAIPILLRKPGSHVGLINLSAMGAHDLKFHPLHIWNSSADEFKEGPHDYDLL